MAKAREFEKTALVVAVLSTLEEKREDLFRELENCFGKIRTVSKTMDFPFTDYYDAEMGSRPVRYFILFEENVDPSSLADIKTRTNVLEMQFLGQNGRQINLDPGILSLSSFILATCKDRSHRIPLKNGIYAETTLIYQDKDFQILPWTYADYSSDEVRQILREFRTIYKNNK